jgi:hypothetical protein
MTTETTTGTYKIVVHELPAGMPEDCEREAVNRMQWSIGACILEWSKRGHVQVSTVHHAEGDNEPDTIEVRCVPSDPQRFGWQYTTIINGDGSLMLPAYEVQNFWHEDGSGWTAVARHPLGGYHFYI